MIQAFVAEDEEWGDPRRFNIHWLGHWVARFNLGDHGALCVEREPELVNCAFLQDLFLSLRRVVLNDGFPHWEGLLNEVASVQVFVLDHTKILDDVRIEVVVVETAIVLEIVGVAIDVDIVQQFVILNDFFGRARLLFLLEVVDVLRFISKCISAFHLSVLLVNWAVGGWSWSRQPRLTRLLNLPVLLSTEAFIDTDERLAFIVDQEWA